MGNNTGSLTGDHQKARALLEESLELGRKVGDKANINWSLHDLGRFALLADEYDKAEQLFDESLHVSRELGDRWGIAQTLHLLGVALRRHGEIVRSMRVLAKGLAMYEELGLESRMAMCIWHLGIAAVKQKEYEFAACLFGIAEGLQGSAYLSRDPRIQREYDQSVATLRTSIEQAHLERAWSRGRQMTIEQALNYVRSHVEHELKTFSRRKSV